MTSDTDLQSWPEVPSIAHFCSLFREAFHLYEFDIQELEESLLLLGTSDESNKLVLQLIVKLLQGCLPMFKKRINQENYGKYLKQLLSSKKEEAEEDGFTYKFNNPFEKDLEKEYIHLDLKEKVLVLHQLCDIRLESSDVGERVKNLDAASLRVEPLGIDSEGNIFWYFYGTRLYQESCDLKSKEERKKIKKHKKEKKKKRKKSKDIEGESSEDEQDTSWSVVCLSEADWEILTYKYKDSREKEDRRLYRLLHDSFLPEIREMFIEKEKEDKRKMQLAVSQRSSSRVERLKKSQEERDRQLALMLAEENSDKKGKRGRKRKSEILEEFNGTDEIQIERDDRAKQREMMKEMRATKTAEKMVEAHFTEDVIKQKSIKKEFEPKDDKDTDSTQTNSTSNSPPRKRPEQDYFPSSEEDSRESSRDSSPSSLSDMDSDDIYRPPRYAEGPKHPRTSSFTNALIKAGSKSTKDSALEKEKQKTLKELMLEKPIVRKTPGLLLQTAGTGLLNKRKEENKDDNGESKPFEIKTGSGISFGLWGGHLTVDQTSVSNIIGSGLDDKPFSFLSKDKKDEPTKKVFSNWGGDFFKKSLDFRANTNKILEKMQLNKITNEPNGATNGINESGNEIS